METKTAPQAAVNGLNYKSDVLSVNKALKEESLKLGYCIKKLISLSDAIKLHPTMLANLQAINTDSEEYKKAVEKIKKTKSGNYSPFVLLQYLYKISK